MENQKDNYESMTTEELESLMRRVYNGLVSLPVNTVFEICDILARRNPTQTDVNAAYQRFLKHYFPAR